MIDSAQPVASHVALGRDGWQIPLHTSDVFSERRHAYALVIPVINEGERIRRQLKRIAAVTPPVDVVIADGGSTDGSVESGLLSGSGARALLTKTGPGRLSAQLRVAYAWCLAEGYEGIVTIDGNGKDGVEAISRFVGKLREGYDYIQGSRYAPGGKAENTPLERSFGNRLIHAPLLSLAGRTWLTDTTNGFRAYSARYLLDPGVQPFRNVFQNYELLFYLTVRAGQIGMRVAEIPVERSYPSFGSIPTKIAGFQAIWSVFRQTVAAASGSFTPD